SDVNISKVKISGLPFVGNPNAPVTMAFWWDYQCSFSKRLESEVEKQIIKDFCKSNFFRDIPVIIGSQEAIHTLSKKYNLAAVTARPNSTYNETCLWLNEHYPWAFSDIHFVSHHFPENGNKKNKSDVCLEHTYGIIIDDYHGHINECAEKGIQTILLNQPWNKREKLHSGALRVRNWEDILQYLNGK
ncbi:MAG: hypothetical protein AABX84_00120, partial [Nanoarchaeota archaeon]